MKRTPNLVSLVASLVLAAPAVAAGGPHAVPASHEELGRTLDDLSAQIHGLLSRWREHFVPGDPAADRPLVSLMLLHRAELGLSPQQVEGLERVRADFQREAIKRDAELRVAEMDLAALRRKEPVDLGQVEAKIREIERLRADLRIARLRAIEQGRALLTPEQRDRLAMLLGEPRPPAGSRRGPHSPGAGGRL